MKNDYDISKTIYDVCKILENNPYTQIKLSNYKNPGFLYIKGGPEWLKQDQSNFKYKVESLSWIPNPKEFYPNMNIYNLGQDTEHNVLSRLFKDSYPLAQDIKERLNGTTN